MASAAILGSANYDSYICSGCDTYVSSSNNIIYLKSSPTIFLTV